MPMKKRSYIAIVAGGTLDSSLLPRIQKADYVIGVDRGAYWLLEHAIVPDVAIGDFDSVTKDEFLKIKKKVAKTIQELPHPKYATDLELAVEYAISLKPKEVGIFGAIGTRFDHSYAGIQVLQKLSSHNIYGYIVDNFNEIYVVRRRLELKPSLLFKYVSIFSLTERTTVTLTGFAYNVSERDFVQGSTLGVSNEIVLDSAQIIVHKGAILLTRSRD